MTKILLVEDDPDLRRGLAIRLLAEGFTTLVAEDGETAISLTHREHPDLVLLDLGLPVTDGFAVLNEIGELPDAEEIRVMVLTGRDPVAAYQPVMQLGADAFLQKPVDNDLLVATIRRLLSDDPRVIRMPPEAVAVNSGGVSPWFG